MTNICVNLEIAKKLKESGWEKYCEFYYEKQYDNYTLIHKESIDNHLLFPGLEAPTAREILDELPIDTHCIKVEDDYYTVGFNEINSDGKTLVCALANMRLRCKENGYLSS